MTEGCSGEVAMRTDHPGPPTVVVSGHLDADCARALRRVTATPDAEHGLVLDLRPCTSIDLPGLGAVVGCIRRIDEGGGRIVVLVTDASPVERMLRSHGVGRLVRIDAVPMAG